MKSTLQILLSLILSLFPALNKTKTGFNVFRSNINIGNKGHYDASPAQQKLDLKIQDRLEELLSSPKLLKEAQINLYFNQKRKEKSEDADGGHRFRSSSRDKYKVNLFPESFGSINKKPNCADMFKVGIHHPENNNREQNLI